ncbi:MAG TPA: DUF429 domain-containing protein [Bryobacteraceae bacterium]|nr:DUF429 domain-containing protein [Bryobacteraceae bacterium]
MKLLIGFDSAWTASNSGAIVAVLLQPDGSFVELGLPRVASYSEAETIIRDWRTKCQPDSTLIFLDQPTVVPNSQGQRPVENIVSSCVSARGGGMQPANTARTDMFGPQAPIWVFLKGFGGAANPLVPRGDCLVIETYPVLILIALGWTLTTQRGSERLPKYNPAISKSFSIDDWKYVCTRASSAFSIRGMKDTAEWLDAAAGTQVPKKNDQDRLDACLCLLGAIHLSEGRECLMAGEIPTGYIVVPHSPSLVKELAARCNIIRRDPEYFVRSFRFGAGASVADKAVGMKEELIAAPPAIANRIEPIAKSVPITSRIPQVARQAPSVWSLTSISECLNRRKQRATYGAVAGLLGLVPRSLMVGQSRSWVFSWIVAANGGRPTGYSLSQIHPDCLRQIESRQQRIISSPHELRAWLQRTSA